MNPVPFYVPVEPNFFALCLTPFGGKVASPVEVFDGDSQGCIRKDWEPKWYESALIIASYIITRGIFPLIALVVTLIHRMCNDYHWLAGQDLPPTERLSQARAGLRDANDTLNNLRNLMGDWREMADRADGMADRADRQMGIRTDAMTGDRPRMRTMADLRRMSTQRPQPKVPLSQRPGGHRLGSRDEDVSAAN